MAKKQNEPIKAQDLIEDDKNFNKGSERGDELLTKSLDTLGAGRSILVDKNNRVIAGNKTLSKFIELGNSDIEIIETTGDKLVVVKRTDIDLDSTAGRELALADNQVSKANFVLADEVLAEVVEAGILTDEIVEGWGVKQKAKNDPFDDKGIIAKVQYGVIVMCETETQQEEAFNKLQGLGYNCKIVVT